MAKFGLFDPHKMDVIREFEGEELIFNVQSPEAVIIRDSRNNNTAIIRLAQGQCVKKLSEAESARAPR
jgi:hypothetical protein